MDPETQQFSYSSPEVFNLCFLLICCILLTWSLRLCKGALSLSELFSSLRNQQVIRYQSLLVQNDNPNPDDNNNPQVYEMSLRTYLQQIYRGKCTSAAAPLSSFQLPHLISKEGMHMTSSPSSTQLGFEFIIDCSQPSAIQLFWGVSSLEFNQRQSLGFSPIPIDDDDGPQQSPISHARIINHRKSPSPAAVSSFSSIPLVMESSHGQHSSSITALSSSSPSLSLRSIFSSRSKRRVASSPTSSSFVIEGAPSTPPTPTPRVSTPPKKGIAIRSVDFLIDKLHLNRFFADNDDASNTEDHEMRAMDSSSDVPKNDNNDHIEDDNLKTPAPPSWWKEPTGKNGRLPPIPSPSSSTPPSVGNNAPDEIIVEKQDEDEISVSVASVEEDTKRVLNSIFSPDSCQVKSSTYFFQRGPKQRFQLSESDLLDRTLFDSILASSSSPEQDNCIPLVIIMKKTMVEHQKTAKTAEEPQLEVLVVHFSSPASPVSSLPTVTVSSHFFTSSDGNIMDLQEIYGLSYTPESNKDREDGNEDSCVVCLSDPKTTTLMPCRHFCVCAVCFTHLSQCPVCRQKVKGYIQLAT